MSPLRTALILILAGSATSALAEQITCESRQERAEACGTVLPGGSVRLVQQLSNTPCVEGSNWGTGPNQDSIWVSGGCRAVFDVQPPPYNSTADNTADRSPEWQRGFDDGQRGTFDRRADSRDYRIGYRAGKDSAQYRQAQSPPAESYRDDRPRSSDEPVDGSRYASADRLRANARRACIDQASAGESFGPDEVTTNDVRWIGHGTFSVSLDTPKGPLICTVDRDGNVVSMDNR